MLRDCGISWASSLIFFAWLYSSVGGLKVFLSFIFFFFFFFFFFFLSGFVCSEFEFVRDSHINFQ